MGLDSHSWDSGKTAEWKVVDPIHYPGWELKEKKITAPALKSYTLTEILTVLKLNGVSENTCNKVKNDLWKL